MKVGFLGFGEAGSHIAEGLHEEGINGIVAYDIMYKDAFAGPIIHQRAKKAHAEIRETPGGVAADADVIFSCVQAKYGVEVFESVKKYLHEGQIYVDTSACLPENMKNIDEQIRKTGAVFVDSAMMNAVYIWKHKVPMLVSGKGAQQFHDLMTPYNMDIEVLDDIAGNASAVKLVRTALIKGSGALIFETLIAAEKMGIGRRVLESCCATFDSYGSYMESVRDCVGGVKHSRRRAEELADCAYLFEQNGINSDLIRCTQKSTEYVASFNLEEKYATSVPEDIMDIIRDMI